MIEKKYIHILIYPLFVSSYLNANQGCNISSFIEKSREREESNPTFKIREEKIKKERKNKNIELKITKKLTSIKIIYENQTIQIKRTPKNDEHTCPPFCIQPMNIRGVKTVGELEVLDFIKELKGKEAKLLIDIRENKEFKQYTIPGAINIPYSMLKINSKYQKQILILLGGEKIGKKWLFKFVPTLLIFGTSDEDEKTYNAINTLLKLSYPNKKIYYYRAGIEGWNRLGLTLY
ncbi:MAG: hypothetical protein DSZ07_01095 [Sulfurovum sp.]|nr:MAG: hypothetical protein DSZ07_01095 [Sulfurovum sp.]